MENSELLKDIHPSFHVAATRVYVNEVVQKVNTHGVLQERILIVTNSGIFLLQQRTFPRSYYVSRIIPFSQLVLIIVDESTMQFYCGGVTMKLRHPKHVQIASIVYSVRVNLFGDKPRPAKIEIAESVADSFGTSDFDFESDSILGDRFLSLALTVPSKKYHADVVAEYREMLKRSQAAVYITPEIISSAYAMAFGWAISLHPELLQLEFDDVSIFSIATILNTILDQSTSLQSLIFRNVSFTGDFQLQPSVRNNMAQTMELTFSQCDLTSNNFFQFFEKLTKFRFDFSALTFDSCTFTITTFDSVMKCITSHKSFENLCKLYFSKLSNISGYVHTTILSLFGSSFMKSSKSIKSLSFVGCGLNVNQIVAGIFKNTTPIEELNLSGNKILMNAEIECITNLHNVTSIDFSECQFTGSSLHTVLSLLSKPIASHINFLGLDKIILDEGGWNLFFNKVRKFTISCRRLSFIGNPMNYQQATAFCEFLSRQKTLRELSISTAGFDGPTVELFANSFKSMELDRIDLINEENAQDHASINPIIKAVTGVKVLHLENQGGGENLLNEVQDLAQRGKLVDLCCDGCNPQSINSIYNFCQNLMTTRLSSANWPERDIKNIILKLQIKERGANKQKMEGLKTEFIKRMGSKKKIVQLPTTPVTDKRNVDAILSKRDINIENIIRECLDIRSGTLKEPLVDALSEINNIVSVEYLYANN